MREAVAVAALSLALLGCDAEIDAAECRNEARSVYKLDNSVFLWPDGAQSYVADCMIVRGYRRQASETCDYDYMTTSHKCWRAGGLSGFIADGLAEVTRKKTGG